MFPQARGSPRAPSASAPARTPTHSRFAHKHRDGGPLLKKIVNKGDIGFCADDWLFSRLAKSGGGSTDGRLAHRNPRALLHEHRQFEVCSVRVRRDQQLENRHLREHDPRSGSRQMTRSLRRPFTCESGQPTGQVSVECRDSEGPPHSSRPRREQTRPRLDFAARARELRRRRPEQ